MPKQGSFFFKDYVCLLEDPEKPEAALQKVKNKERSCKGERKH